MPTTDIIAVPVAAGSNIAQLLKSYRDKISRLAGFQACEYGLSVEHPDLLEVFNTWDSLSHIEASEQEPDNSAAAAINEIITAEPFYPSAQRINFEPAEGLLKALGAPVTEIATFYFEGTPSDEYLAGVCVFQSAVKAEVDSGPLASAAGMTHAEVERDGVKGKAVKLVIGWESVERHNEFRKTKAYKENIALLAKGPNKIEMHHVAFQH
ncbi:hypothetical protein Z517_08177 [Fonsecaea pedrosoi CBS 271.37]|uniref:Unplaced genomic scaffold supercont1.5, whole genome shotgun sequence n=1 Tax=Fonsecaea pedrosoi CBS 271.37 TaxID=1442368 RepID=A0A0D2EVS7_9EURO|nr:uncharacterized protein Z517_08177 [Fonsecaea pedrosoi CBS 271.37]KIW78342.1 hypothetical protein Z517_08177 [Fonsecaea pedrosoi CBS 271.37]